MRKLLMGAAAAFAIAAPGAASAEVGGNITATYATLDEEGDDAKEDAWAVDGAVVANLGNNWLLQFDGALADMDHTSHTDSFTQLEAHAGYDFGGFTAGLFVSRFDWGGGSPYNLIGVEAGAEFGRFSLDGAYASGEANDSGSGDISNAAVRAGFALTEAFNIHADYSNTQWPGDDESDAWGVGVGYAIPNTNFAVGGGWRTFESDFGVEAEGFGVSLRWNFGDQADPMIGASSLVSDAVLYQ